MKRGIQGLGAGLLLISFAGFSCSSLPELRVQYQLPPAGETLRGKSVAVAVEDARDPQELLGPGAREAFGGFSGNVSFSLARYGEPGFLLGLYPAGELIGQAVERRLRNAGAEVLAQARPQTPHLRILLRKLRLDRSDRQWLAQIEYEARLAKQADAHLSAYQSVAVEGERFGLVGRGAADTLMSELFTEAVNRLNPEGLFRQAGLLP
jgi:hypothetical protein